MENMLLGNQINKPLIIEYILITVEFPQYRISIVLMIFSNWQKKRIRNWVFSWMKIIFSLFLLRSFIQIWLVISMPSAVKLIKGCIVYERSEKWLYTKMKRCSRDINVLHGRCWMSFVYWLSFPVSDRGVCFGLNVLIKICDIFSFRLPAASTQEGSTVG